MKPGNSKVPRLAQFGFIALETVVVFIGTLCMRDHHGDYPMLELVHLWLSVTLLMASVLMFFRDWRLALSGVVIIVVTGIRIRFPVF